MSKITNPNLPKPLSINLQVSGAIQAHSFSLPWQDLETNPQDLPISGIYLPVKGQKFNGYDFLDLALKSKKALLIAEKAHLPDEWWQQNKERLTPAQWCEQNVWFAEDHSTLIFTDRDFFLKHWVSLFQEGPLQSLVSVGVTGTNGKTSTTFLIFQALSKIIKEPNIALLGTVEWRLGGLKMPAKNTTPLIPDFVKMLQACVLQQQKYLIMEVSSHGLALGRIANWKFDVVLFTNLSHDHLDFHHTMENYLEAKKLLFSQHLKSTGHAVIMNHNDEWSTRLVGWCRQNLPLSNTKIITPVSSSSSPQNIEMRIISSLNQLRESHFSVSADESKTASNVLPLICDLIGLHNFENVALAWQALKLITPAQYLPLNQEIFRGTSIPGRMNVINSKCGIFIVDYAHSPDSLSRVGKAIKEFWGEGKKYRVVFGCGGDRDRQKRPLMLAAALLNFTDVVLTTDNPRSEEPEQIMADILSQQSQQKESGLQPKIEVILDRAQALLTIVNTSRPETVTLVAGKGHEDYQEIKGVKFSFDDLKMIQSALHKIGCEQC